jgi:murein L,D-transpeptidase YafK
VQAEFVQVIRQGEDLFKLLEIEKQNRAMRIRRQMTGLKERLHHLDQCSRMTNENKASRRNLTRAEVALNEARTLYEGKQYLVSEEKLNDVETHLSSAERLIIPVLSRYRDKRLIRKWKRWAEETIEESADRESYSMVVIKAERKLYLYEAGDLVKTYPVGLGRSGWSDKQRSRDNATPEGRYRIIGKKTGGPYHRALLINYPNEDDQEEFHRARRKGLLPKSAGIGGSIEIHGGGSKGLTYGCISVANDHIEELYRIVEEGTPIAIVGALDSRNSLSSALSEIRNGRKKKTP